MSRGWGFLLLATILAGPAQAHKLKVFAAVENGSVTGYGFFVGGGRPQGSAWTAKDAAGRAIAAGETDAEGRFRFDWPDGAKAVTITVDTHEAHIASATLMADRLAAKPGAPSASQTAAGAPSVSDADVAALVDAAVQRQVEPVLERLEAMDSRLRLVDALSGIFLIIGLGGATLWARNQRR